MGRLQNKVAIVSGAAGGIGSAISRAFAVEGASVLGVDTDAPSLEALGNAVRAAGGRASTLCADVADEDAARSAVARARNELGGIDILVCGAVADVPLAPVTKLSLADWRRTFAVNLDSAFLLSKHAIPAMGGVPIKRAANAVAGRLYSSCGAPFCSMRPSRIRTMRSAMVMASLWSCVT